MLPLPAFQVESQSASAPLLAASWLGSLYDRFQAHYSCCVALQMYQSTLTGLSRASRCPGGTMWQILQ